MVNYRNSKVYKIWSTQGENIYIGSTTKQYLCQRMDKHRSNYKAFQNGTSRRDTCLVAAVLYRLFGHDDSNFQSGTVPRYLFLKCFLFLLNFISPYL